MSTATVPTTVEIYAGQDFYVPVFEVKLRKSLLPKDVVRDVIQVTYKDNIDEIDSFELTINNWDAETRSFKYSDTTLFDPGAELQLSMGYYGKNALKLMITGQITSLRPSFPAGGAPTLAIGGLNLLHKLRTKQETSVYEKRTDSQIARQIAGRLKVDLALDNEAAGKEQPLPYLIQDNQYDILFLMERARFNGYDIYVTEPEPGSASKQPVLHFGPSDGLKRVTYRLSYGRSLIEFQPTLTTANQVSEVIVRGWDPVHKKKIEGKADRSQLKTKGVGERGGQKAIEESFNKRQEIMVRNAPTTEAEARRLALRTLEQNAKDMVTGNGSIVGLPDLRAGSVVEIDGLGTRFSGRYFVTSTTHSIGDGGYTTQFECRREELQR
jgi:phage protein D